MIKKNIIDEGIEDSEVSEKNSENLKESGGILIKAGDSLKVKSVSGGEIVLVAPLQKKRSEEDSEGSYMVRE